MNEDLYLLVPWPESQDYMECDWFYEECVGHPVHSGAYFIPAERLGLSKLSEQELADLNEYRRSKFLL